MKIHKSLLIPLMLVFVMTFSAPAVNATEIDDSNLFINAFSAYQKRDYLYSVENISQLNQLFPDSPLRDVALLLLARSSWKSGDNEAAARTINTFLTEFPNSALKTSIEEDLQILGASLQKGEKLQLNKQLRLAAEKVRKEQVAIEKATAEKAERERIAREKAERDRIAHEKAEAERKERERIAREKAEKDSIKVSVLFPAVPESFEAGKNAQMPFEVANNSKAPEEFIIESAIPSEYGALVSAADSPSSALTGKRLIPQGGRFKGVVSFKVPANFVDGQKGSFAVKAVSAKFADVSGSKSAQVIASAPLLRAVAKPMKTTIMPGEDVRYRITVLNVGSMPAKNLSVRISLPAEIELVDASGETFRQESAGVVAFDIESLNTGAMKDYSLNTKVRDTARPKKDVRCQVELINPSLQLKETYQSSVSEIRTR